MAIVIEEEKGRGGWFGFGVLILVLVILGVAVYYLFFIKPEFLLTKVAPLRSLQPIDELTKINFNPADVLSSPFFKSLSPVISPPSVGQPPGNSSPFGVF